MSLFSLWGDANKKARQSVLLRASGTMDGLAASDQYRRLGNCMERTRLKWRLTAAAFLRLRSAVGFS